MEKCSNKSCTNQGVHQTRVWIDKKLSYIVLCQLHWEEWIDSHDIFEPIEEDGQKC